jgi:hypothetical protein
MSTESTSRYKERISTYIRAKDQNRPHLMQHAFLPDATLHMKVNSQTIAFPPVSYGCEAIADVLVRRFSSQYENVYTFCLEPVMHGTAPADTVEIDWLVVMVDKVSGEPRVGCGSYLWKFEPKPAGRVRALDITIEHMQVLEPARLDKLLEWVGLLPYPWCPAEKLLAWMPAMKELASVAAYLRRSV